MVLSYCPTSTQTKTIIIYFFISFSIEEMNKNAHLITIIALKSTKFFKNIAVSKKMAMSV